MHVFRGRTDSKVPRRTGKTESTNKHASRDWTRFAYQTLVILKRA